MKFSSSNKSPRKVVIAGDGGTGKSTLIATKQQGKFAAYTKMTIGVDFHILKIRNKNETPGNKINESTLINNLKKDDFKSDSPRNMLVFDLGGQERFQFMHQDYVRGGHAAIILYDLTREMTFDHIHKWYNLLTNVNPNISIILAGSKLDEVQPEDIEYYKKKWEKIAMKNSFPRIIKHHFFSSKSYEGVDELFILLESELKNLNNNSALLIENIVK